MIYGDILDTMSVLNTGATVPDNIAFLTKLVCGKISRKRLPDLLRLAEISTGGSNVINLKTALSDFLDFKLDPENDNRIIYSLDSDNNPYFYKLLSSARFAQNYQGGVAKKEGYTLTLSVPEGETTPATIYFPYYSFYCFKDEITDALKEVPTSNGDELVINPAFDDVVIDGILLYISRREKEDKEFVKNVQEWDRRVNEIIYYS